MAIKPGTPHPTKRGLVMGNNKRYVAKGTYNRQKANASKPSTKTPPAKPGGNFRAPSVPKPKPRLSTAARVARSAARTAKTVGGSLTAQKAIADSLKPVTDSIAKNVVRGAVTATGGNTRNLDRMNAGKPVVKSVNGVDFNVATAAGRAGYAKAIAKRNQEAQGSRSARGAGRASFRVEPSSSKPSSTKPKYPTTAVTNTVKKSRDYQVEAKAKAKAQSQAKSKPAKDRGKRDYGSKEKNMAAWRKANPALAKALDKRNAAKAKRLEESKKKRAKKRAGGTLYSGRTLGNSSRMA